MKLCLFQGTFNPIHNAHLKVCEYAKKQFNFDKILVIPAANPPHKSVDRDLAYHRLRMAEIAVKDKEYLEVSDIEYLRSGLSYTYLTVKELYNLYDIEGKISFIIGTDASKNIESWYEADKLKELVDFVVFIRENKFDPERFEYLREKGYRFEFMPLEFLDISSTDIREKVKRQESIQRLVPQKVEEYIKINDLYKS